MKRAARIGLSLGVFALLALPLPAVLRFDHDHLLTSVILAVMLSALSLWSRAAGILTTLAYLIFLGDYRRYAGFLQGYPFSDPLLLVGPVAAFFLAALVLVDGKARRSSALGLLVAMLAILMAAEIFNPEQGGISVGLAGALFYLVPMLWFWVGRAYGGGAVVEQLLRRLVVPVAVCAALLGSYQAFYGVLPFEAAWARQVDFGALYVSADVRPLGFFTSPAEFVRFLLMASAIIVAYWLRSRSRLILLLPLLLIALFLGSTRTAVVMFVATTVVSWAVLARSSVTWLPRAAVAGVAGAGLVAAGLIGLQQAHVSSRVDALVTHQVEGLLNPTDTEKSTAVGHVVLAREALLSGVMLPAGKGLGATTLAAQKYGAGVFSAEVDVANVFYSLGILGGLLYLAVMAAAIACAISVWKARRTGLQLATLALVLCTLTAWLTGGEYSIAAIVWFVLGSVDRAALEVAAESKASRRHPSPRAGVIDPWSPEAGLLRPRSRAHAPGTDHT